MKLIVTDLDHTLLKSDQSVSKYTLRVIAQCKARGWKLAFASARSEHVMASFVQALRPDAMISNGGAKISVHGQVIHRNLMQPDDVQTILSMYRKLSNRQGKITLESEDGYFCNYDPNDLPWRQAYTYTDFSYFKQPAYKITPELEKPEWAETIVKECKAVTAIPFSGEKWCRFAAKGADKETGLTILLEYLRIHPRDCVAFGDDLNDLGMLRAAGTAVAVANAIEEVKAIADDVCGSNDQDGVASYLEAMLQQEFSS